MDNPSITLFTCPKAFTGDTVRLQANAVRSWKALATVEEIVLVGDDPGVAAFCEDEQVTWGGAVQRNVYGTPLLDSIFELGEAIAQTEWVAYVNADILLLDDFGAAVIRCAEAFPHFLMSGQRFNGDLPNDAWIGAEGIAPALYDWMKRHSVPEGAQAADYFVWRKGDLGDIPPFALGAFRWDNWLLDRPRQLGFPLVDATDAVFDVHQNHAPRPRVAGDVELHGNDWLVSQHGGRLGRLTDADYRMEADGTLVALERI